ncbi:hypothetical protein BASA62_010359 [Batrachochytrium salamandrivorans]|nr:hypothetical protein BASA62_010359 [Batrachochytrium salamandrivorans]
MKFRALVVAAMVITSVNAAGKGGLMGCLGGRCTSRSDSEQNLLGDEQGPAMPQDAAGNEQEPGMPQDPSNNESGESRSLDHTKKEQSGDLVVGKRDPACSGMAFSLGELQNKIIGLAKSFNGQLPSLHVVTSEIVYWEAMYNRNIFQKYRKVKVGVKNTKKLSELSKEYGEAKANLKGTYRPNPHSPAPVARLYDFLRVVYRRYQIHIVANTTWDRLVEVILN